VRELEILGFQMIMIIYTVVKFDSQDGTVRKIL
jgi:hypothetical protein